MPWFRRGSYVPPQETPEIRAAKLAAQRAAELVANNNREIQEARSLVAAIQDMRMKNHLAEKLSAVFRGETA